MPRSFASGRAQKSTVDRIIAMLEDEDRLVRESACLALGSLKAGGKSEEAVANRLVGRGLKQVVRDNIFFGRISEFVTSPCKVRNETESNRTQQRKTKRNKLKTKQIETK